MHTQNVVRTYVYGFEELGPEKHGLKTSLEDHPVIIRLAFSFTEVALSKTEDPNAVLVLSAVFDKGTSSLFQFARDISQAGEDPALRYEVATCELTPVPDSEDQVFLEAIYLVELEPQRYLNIFDVGMELIALLKKHAGVVWDPLPVPVMECEIYHHDSALAEAGGGRYVDQDTYFKLRYGCKTE
jgi:hypothetical protein